MPDKGQNEVVTHEEKCYYPVERVCIMQAVAKQKWEGDLLHAVWTKTAVNPSQPTQWPLNMGIVYALFSTILIL